MICPLKIINPKENQNMQCIEQNCAWFIDVVIKDTHIRQCAIKTIAWSSVEKFTETISKGGEKNG